MKRIIYAAILIFFTMLCYAQSTPEAFLGLLPAVPTIDCGTESSRQTEAITAFQSQINTTREKLSEAIRVEKQKNKNTKLSERVKREASVQSGLTESELERVSNKKSSSSERERLTNKSVQNQTGFSMDEMQQVKSMSKADRQKWAMNNYGKVMEKEQQKAEDTKQYQTSNASLGELGAEQQKLAVNLRHHRERLDRMKNELETAASQQSVILENKIKEIKRKYENVNDGEGATAEDMRKLRERNKLIRDAKIEYCSKLTPLNINYLIHYEAALKENILPDLKRSEDINYQIQRQTYSKTELSCFDRLRAIEDYTSALSKAFNFYMSVNKE